MKVNTRFISGMALNTSFACTKRNVCQYQTEHLPVPNESFASTKQNAYRYLISGLILLYLVLLPASLFAQREMKTINEGWKFMPGDHPNPTGIDFDDSSWEPIALPHTWNTDAYTVKDYYKGVCWYRKTLNLSGGLIRGEKVFLKFEAASKSAEVFLNGHSVGVHRGGYTAFTFDITPYCSFDSPNIIAVCVDNSRQDIPPISGDFTFFGGIYRDAWLITTPGQHFDLLNHGSNGVFIQTPEVTEERASLVIKGSLRNDATEKADIILQHNIYNPSGAIILSSKKKMKLKAGEAIQFNEKTLSVANPELWSPESPSLYKVESIILNAKTSQLIDKVTNYTGFRWYKFDSEKGFFLNGKPYKLRGVCRHQDQKPIGVALTDEMHRRDMMLMKDMGANFIRISHYPQDNAILEQCDKLGMLVWEEIPIIDIVPDTEGYAEACETNLREMIRQHYNHPSVITWGYMNEILLVTTRRYKTEEELKPIIERTVNLAKHLEQVLKEEDPYRVSTVAFHGSNVYNEVGLGDINDVIGWNLYSGWYGGDLKGFDRFLDEQHQEYPTHPIIVSEYGAGSDKRLHSFQPKSFDFSIEYQQEFLEHYLPAMEERDFVAGGTHWNFIDFSSALRDESMPRINNKGLVYADRTPKDVYYYFKSMFRKDAPVLYIASRDWTKRTGLQSGSQPVIQPLKLYTNLAEAELILNGQSLGRKNSKNYSVIFDVPFVNGKNVLIARGMHQGKLVEDALTIDFRAIPLMLNEESLKGLELAINIGSNCYFTGTESHLTWVPDQELQPGSNWGYVTEEGKNKTTSVQTEIHLTHDGPLYQTSRTNISSYFLGVPAGEYEVELLFADVFKPRQNLVYQLGQPEVSESLGNTFDIYFNSVLYEKDFSPAAEAGYYSAVKKRYIVDTTGEGLRISFRTLNGQNFLSGLKIRKL